MPRGLGGGKVGRGRLKNGLVEDITSDIDIGSKRPVRRRDLPDIPLDIIPDISVDPPKKPPLIIRPPIIDGLWPWGKKPHIFIAKKEDVERAERESIERAKLKEKIAITTEGGFKQVLTTPGAAVTAAAKEKKTLIYIIIGAVVVVGFIAMRRK